MNTPLRFTSPEPLTKPTSNIIATVMTCKDPDVPVGAQVTVTGYIAIVPSITRRNTMGSANVSRDTAHAFDLDELRFDDQGASFVLQSVKDQITAAIHKAQLPPLPEGAQITLVEQVQRLARYYSEAAADCGRTRVDRLPKDTLLLPEVWATLLGHEVMDWDGWNDMGRDLSHECNRAEFDERIVKCTTRLVNVAPPRLHHPEPTAAIETVMPCCGYVTKQGQPTPIYWNPYNKVVQCHNCGQVYGFPEAKPEDNEAGRSLKHDGCVCVEAGVIVQQCPVHGNRIRSSIALSMIAPDPEPMKLRHRLPDTRYALTHKFDVGGQKGYVTVGFYDEVRDGEETMDLSKPGEVFVVVQRQGSTLQGFADAWARSVSMLLQYGVPVSEVCRMFAWHKFEPRGITPNPDIRVANSIVDYVARWLGHTCIENYQPGGEPIAEVPDNA